MFCFNKVGKISYVGEPGAAADESFSTSTGSFLNPFPLSFWKRKHQPCFGQWGESVWRMSPFSLTSSSLVTSHNLQGLPCTQAGWKHQGKCPKSSQFLLASWIFQLYFQDCVFISKCWQNTWLCWSRTNWRGERGGSTPGEGAGGEGEEGKGGDGDAPPTCHSAGKTRNCAQIHRNESGE